MYEETGEDMSEKNQKLYEEIADRLIQRIQSGELQPGDRLPSERVLAKEYSVSRSVIREAFRFMERMGCVDSRVGEGTFVKSPEISDIADPLSILFMQDDEMPLELIETRLILETAVARLAALRRTDEQLGEMRRTLKEMQLDILKGGKGIEQDAKFHAQLAEAAGNRALKIVISTCSEVLSRSMEVTQQIEGVPQYALIDHENILEAIEKQDDKAAESYMRGHLHKAHENLQKAQEKDPGFTVVSDYTT